MDGPESAAGCQNSGLLNTEVLRWARIPQGPNFTGEAVTVGEGFIWDDPQSLVTCVSHYPRQQREGAAERQAR